MTGFVGGGAHWRVLRVPVLGYAERRADMWQVYRRAWDHWETIGSPFLSHVAAMTEAHRLARLHRA